MADIPTDVIQATQIIDPKTGQLTKTGLQTINAIIRVLRDLNIRVTDLE